MAAREAATLAEASACKLYAAQAAMEVALEAVQLFGGNGYMAEFQVEQLCRDAKVLQIYGGTDEIQVSQIARSMLAGSSPCTPRRSSSWPPACGSSSMPTATWREWRRRTSSRPASSAAGIGRPATRSSRISWGRRASWWSSAVPRTRSSPGLLHAAYPNGDFGVGPGGATPRNRAHGAGAIGEAAER
jgi:hypothetical protein